MIVVNEELLNEFRTSGRCEWCGKNCYLREPNHVFGRGLGGGARLDIRCNLISLGSTPRFQCACHTLYHAGKIARGSMLQAIAAREKCTIMDIEDVIYWFRRLPKDPTPEIVKKRMTQLRRPAMDLAAREWERVPCDYQ